MALVAVFVWMQSVLMVLWGAWTGLRRRSWRGASQWLLWGATLFVVSLLLVGRFAPPPPGGGQARGLAADIPGVALVTAFVAGLDMVAGGAVTAARARAWRPGRWWLLAGAGLMLGSTAVAGIAPGLLGR